MKSIEDYFDVNQCFICESKLLKITKKMGLVLDAKVMDLPHIFCKECYTYYLPADLIMELEKIIKQNNLNFKKITFDQIWEKRNEFN